MSKIGAVMNKPLGPMPVGLWVLGIGGGLGIAWYLRNHQSAAPAAAVPTTTDPGILSAGTGGAAESTPDYFGSVAPASTVNDNSDTVPTGTASYTDNAAWRIAAVRSAQALGTPGIAAENMIGRYLTGGTLTAAEGARMNQIISQVGPTPTPVTAVKVQSATTGTPIAINAQWVPAAANNLLTKYRLTASKTTAILNKYLTGGTLTAAEQHVVQLAIATTGAPPVAARRPAPIAQPKAKTTPKKHAPARRDTGRNHHTSSTSGRR